jgi:hypothetical protein
MAVTLAGLWGPTTPATAGPSESRELRGPVERMPDTPDTHGEWKIAGQTVVVGPQTRLEDEARGIGVGRLVKAKVRPSAGGLWQAVEVELHDERGERESH